MKRMLTIVGCAALIIAGLAVTTLAECWVFVWTIGFPLAYTGLLGIIKATRSRAPGK